MISALVDINYYVGLGGIYPPSSRVCLKYESIEAAVSDLITRFPFTYVRYKKDVAEPVVAAISMHNEGGIDIRASISEEGPVPDDRCRHGVSIEVYLYEVNVGATDKLWADLIEALVKAKVKVKVDIAPSEHIWSIVGRVATPDPEAISRAKAALAA